jgi:RNA polymerase sigma factor (TIGR02999 family)
VRRRKQEALDALTPVVYSELRPSPRLSCATNGRATPNQPTALIHEAYLQLVGQELPDFQSRAHFFGVAAHVMRQILIAGARRRCAKKRGGGADCTELDDIPIPPQQSEELLAVHDALDRLALRDQRKAKVIELKYRQWSLLAAGVQLGYPFWSRDGKYVYFQDLLNGEDQPIFRVRISGRKVEKLMSAKDLPQSDVTGYTLTGLDPNDEPIANVLRSNSDVYALDLNLP